MKTQNHFRILVLEDSEFYNNILTRKLQNYIDNITFDKDCSFDIQSYTSANDCLHNLNSETDIAFVDYYLSDNKNALDVLSKIKQKCNNCKVIIMSQSKDIKASFNSTYGPTSDFFQKDPGMLMRCCYIVEHTINERLSTFS